MGDNTKIEWADATVNFWHGCKKVSQGCKFCVDPDTLILMSDYTQKKISDIKKGDSIFSVAEHSKNQSRKFVKAIIEEIAHTEKETFEITTANSTIICSMDHPFLVRGKRSWVKPTKFKVAQTKLSYLALDQSPANFNEMFMKGYIAGVTDGDGTFRYDENWGSVYKKESKQCYWRVAVKDQVILDRIILFGKQLFGVELEAKLFYEGSDKHEKVYKVESRSQAFLRKILQCIAPQDNADFYKGYLSGMFDAEGNMSRYFSGNRNRINALRIAQKTKKHIINKIKISLEKLDFKFSIGKTGFTLLGGNMEKIRFFSNTIPSLSRSTDLFGIGSTHHLGMITGIKYLGKRKLIDIQTSSRTFVANGFIVHNCYMYRDKARYNQDGSKVVRAKNDTFFKALKWAEPRRIFTCSWSDFFIKDADPWRAEAWDVIKKTPQHTWLILTKRPERILQCLPKDWGDGYPNVWLGVSIENEKTAYNRIMQLFEVRTKIRFLSVEPLLQKINLAPFLAVALPDKRIVNPLHWVIVGGESGNEIGEFRYRNTQPEWIADIIGKCKQHDIPVFIKQLGTGLAKKYGMKGAGENFEDPKFPVAFKIRQLPSIVENE